MKQKKKSVKEKKKQRKHVYGIHDLLFFPLVLGMAFTKNEEKEEKVQKAREEVVDHVSTQLEIIEEKFEQIAQAKENDQLTSVLDETQSERLVVEGARKQEQFETVQEELIEMEQELLSLTIDEEEKDTLLASISLEDEDNTLEENPEKKEMILEETLKEYHTWLEEQSFQEQFYDVKEKEIEVKGELLIEDEAFDISCYEENQEELKKQLSSMMKTMETSEKELERVKNQLAQPIEKLEKVRMKVEFTSSRLLETVLLSSVVSKSKLNPLSKFVLQTMIISHAMRQSRKVVRTTEKIKPINFEKQLYACLSDTRYLENMIDGNIDQCKRMKKAFLLEFSSMDEQIKEYDDIIKQFDDIQNSLQDKKRMVESLQADVEKQRERNRQKQKEYLNP